MQHEDTRGAGVEGGEERKRDANKGDDKQKHVVRWTEAEREGGKAKKGEQWGDYRRKGGCRRRQAGESRGCCQKIACTIYNIV